MNWRCLKDDPPTGQKVFLVGRWANGDFEWTTTIGNIDNLAEHWTHWCEPDPCPKPKTLKQIEIGDIPKDGTQFVVMYVWNEAVSARIYKYTDGLLCRYVTGTARWQTKAALPEAPSFTHLTVWVYA